MNPERTNPDRADLLLDACLEEVLGGRTPPDLTARIAQAWLAQGGRVAGWEAYANGYAAPPGTVTPPTGMPHVPMALPVANAPAPFAIPIAPMAYPVAPQPPMAQPIAPHPLNGHAPQATPIAVPMHVAAPPMAEPPVAREPAAPPVAAAPKSPKVTVSRPTPEAGSTNWTGWIVGVSLVLVVGVVGYIATRGTPDDGGNGTNVVKEGGNDPKPGTNVVAPVGPSGATPKPPVRPVPSPSAIVETPGTGRTPAVVPMRVAPLPEPEIVTFVNATLRDGWNTAGVQPSRPASDEEWARRLFVRLLGRSASEDEVRAFAAETGVDKRAALVDRLMTAPQYKKEFTVHWGGFWTKALLGRDSRDANALARAELLAYLTAAVEKNTPFDKIATQLITATGSDQKDAADYNPATHFLLAAGSAKGDRGVAAANRTARVFLGLQMQCAQCHQHPTSDWTQDHYWQLSSFFRQMTVTKSATGRSIVDADFAGDAPATDMFDGLTYFEDPTGKMRAVGPKFLGSFEIAASSPLSETNRRVELAKLVVASPYFNQAIVNRVWAHFLGVGFTNPVDEMGSHNPRANPELLQKLAEQWAAHGHDPRMLLKWIALSEAFGLSSEVGPQNESDDPDAGRTPLFARFYVRPPAAEPVQQVLVAMAKAVRDGGGAGIQGRLSHQARVIETMKGGGEFEGIIAAPREILQSAANRRALTPSQKEIVRRIAESRLEKADKIDHLFQYALGRSPSAQERNSAEALLAAHREGDAAAWENLWWALLGSSEFGP